MSRDKMSQGSCDDMSTTKNIFLIYKFFINNKRGKIWQKQQCKNGNGIIL